MSNWTLDDVKNYGKKTTSTNSTSWTLDDIKNYDKNKPKEITKKVETKPPSTTSKPSKNIFQKGLDVLGDLGNALTTTTPTTQVQRAGTTGRPMPKFDTVKQDKAGKTAGAFTANLVDSATLGAIPAISNKLGFKDFAKGYTNELNKASEGHKTASMVGNLAGYALPFAGAEKIVAAGGKAAIKAGAKPLTNKLLKTAIKGATEGALVGGAEGGIRGKNVVKNAGEMAALGAGGNLAIGALGKVVNKVLKPRALTEQVNIPKIEETPSTTSTEPINAIKKIQLNGNKFKVNNPQYDKAINNWNDAIETIQNHFQTNKLVPEEMPKIKAELGIDLNALHKNITKYENKLNLKEISNRQNQKYIYGVEDRLTPKLQTKDINVPTTTEIPTMNATETIKPNSAKVNSTKIKGQELPNGEKLRSFPISVENSNLSPEYSKMLSQQADSYKPISNTETWESATKNVLSDSNKAHQDFMQSGKYKQTADDTALGEALIVDAIKKGDFTKANDVTAELADRLTTAGQQIQAASIINKLSPEGMLLYAQKQVNRVNRELDKGLKNKLSRKVVLTPEDTKAISDVMNKVKDMPEGYDKEAEIATVMKLIGNKIPKSLMNKVSTFQTIAMLGNPKTMIRNTVGNAIFAGAENTSNALGAGIDKLVSLKTGKRTTTLPNLGTQIEGAGNGIKRVAKDFARGIDTSPNRTQFDLPQTPAFENVPLLGKAEKLTTYGLKMGDTPFWQAAYDESLRQQMKIAKITEPTMAMKEQAGKLADYRTYQDTNKVTEMFTGLKKAFNKVGTKEFGLGDLILKFPKTPANILARAIDYSPAGFANLAKKAMSGTIDQKQFVDGLSRIIVGTSIGGSGYALAKNGLATGRASKDKDVAAIERQAGENPYSLKLGNKNLTYDWAQPLSMPFAVGANISKNKVENMGLGETIMNALAEGTNTLSEQSVMQGVKRFFNGQGSLSENVGNSLAGLPASFVPSILKQFGQLTDDNARDTYSNDFIEKNVTNQIKNKVPLLRNTLSKKVDTLGNDTKEFQGNNNLFNVFLNPGTLTNNNINKNQKLVLDIYNKSKDNVKTQFPRVAPTKINGTSLTPKQHEALQREMGKETNDMLNSISKRYNIDNMTNKQLEHLADVIESKLTKIQKKSKQKILPKELLNIKKD